MVSVNAQGHYDVVEQSTSSFIEKGFRRLMQQIHLSGTVTPRAKQVDFHDELVTLLAKTPFQLLDNDTITIPVKDTFLNISGLGEYMLGKADPQQAFQKYRSGSPGIVLAHNPDAIPGLQGYPGDIVLCGHTHGAEIHLPWLWRKFTLIENPQFKRGLKKWMDRWVYTTRGIGGSDAFRLFSNPGIIAANSKGL